MKKSIIVMKIHTLLLSLIATAGLMATGSIIYAQDPMPQDHWTYYGKNYEPSWGTKTFHSITKGGEFIYISSGNSSYATYITKLNSNLEYQGGFSGFTSIWGMDCDSDGNLYAFDYPYVKVYDPSGALLRSWRSGGTGPASGAGSFASVFDGRIAIDKDDRICLFQAHDGWGEVYDKLGVLLFKFGELGSLPSQMYKGNGTIFFQGDNIALWQRTGQQSSKILLYDHQGNFLSTSNKNVLAEDYTSTSPDNLALSSDGTNLKLMSSGFEVIQEIIPSALNLNSSPKGVCFDEKGNLYVAVGSKVLYCERRYRTTDNPLASDDLPLPYVSSIGQVTGTTNIEINYGIKDSNDATVEARLLAFKDGIANFSNIIPIRTYVGDTSGKIGLATPTNVEHQLVWNAAADWSTDFGQLKVEVLAKDTRKLLGVHWVTIPSNGGNPEIVVSKRPVLSNDLLSICFWLIAGDDSRVTLENGELKATGGDYSGQVIASGSAVTSTGREFLFSEILGMRAITAEELTRVSSGNLMLESVTAESVVLEPAP